MLEQVLVEGVLASRDGHARHARARSEAEGGLALRLLQEAGLGGLGLKRHGWLLQPGRTQLPLLLHTL